ncbi:DDE Tnp IS1595 domain-containing protein [Aphis craccivora]|uniref:DDE Tnp IS1595 domain-containing protein n=1 Tax=Aphis craccivora TaxID=307492 RepID=A0A6G0YHN5_APHCR|nr:DDE Tnp IS1595 domain-containing protein [Aphis craccivora]
MNPYSKVKGNIILNDYVLEIANPRKYLMKFEESSDEDEVINNQNYGQRIQGPWIFGLYCKHDGILERRFFKVEKRDRNTLLPIILNEVEQGTTIYSHKWRAYEHEFIHKTVSSYIT